MDKRPPIVTVLGHVDHGKTTLLDALRKTKLADREAGGITQGVGASKIKTDQGFITFIDTPGHEAFSQMRERGAKVADIALLVVAADDGPKPQTKEALKYIKDSSTPYIVVFTKTDLPSADLEKAMNLLMQEEVLLEGRGGDVPYVSISAKNGEGLDDLLEMIHLVADVNDIGSSLSDNLEAVVIETNKDNRGPVVSLVVKSGFIKKGDDIYAGSFKARVKGMFDENGKPVSELKPGDPALVLGFSELPEVGNLVSSEPGIAQASDTQSKKKQSLKEGEIGVVLKVKSTGSIDAIVKSLPEEAKILSSGVGEVTESDIFFAKASNSSIFTFEAKVPNQVKKLADNESVEIYDFKIIYELIDKVKELVKASREEFTGKLDILDTFPYNKLLVAGCKVIEGKIKATDSLKLFHNDKEKGVVRIKSLRRGKNELTEALAGEECGVLFVPQLDFEVGDTLCVIKK